MVVWLSSSSLTERDWVTPSTSPLVSSGVGLCHNKTSSQLVPEVSESCLAILIADFAQWTFPQIRPMPVSV